MPISRRAVTLSGLAAMAAAPNAFAQAVPPGAPGDPRPRSYALLGEPAPDFWFPNPFGGMRQLSDYRGQVLILYFWGLWCPDCLLDGPNVARLAEDAAETPGVSFLGIHTRGRYGRWGSIEAYFAERGYGFPVVIDEGREFARDVYRIEWYPSFLAIDGAGIIRAWRTDLASPEGAAQFLAQARALRA
jgi:thiol-disulfide isomerase/thioredoxin